MADAEPVKPLCGVVYEHAPGIKAVCDRAPHGAKEGMFFHKDSVQNWVWGERERALPEVEKSRIQEQIESLPRYEPCVNYISHDYEEAGIAEASDGKYISRDAVLALFTQKGP